jgi:hypothetical protein
MTPSLAVVTSQKLGRMCPQNRVLGTAKAVLSPSEGFESCFAAVTARPIDIILIPGPVGWFAETSGHSPAALSRHVRAGAVRAGYKQRSVLEVLVVNGDVKLGTCSSWTSRALNVVLGC